VIRIPDPSPQDEACLKIVIIMRYGLRVCHVIDHKPGV
jgi:hypothetical protein